MAENKGKGPIYDPGLCRCCGTMKKCRILNVEYFYSGQKEVYSDMFMDCFGLVVNFNTNKIPKICSFLFMVLRAGHEPAMEMIDLNLNAFSQLSYLDAKPTERLICAMCVSRLREAESFRRQVLQCEEAFLQMKMYDEETGEVADDPMKKQEIKIELGLVKTEPEVEMTETQPQRCDIIELNNEGIDCSDEDTKPTMDRVNNDDSSSSDDVPLKSIAKKIPSPAKRKSASKKMVKVKPSTVKPQVLVKKTEKMSKVQQLIRSRDPSYVTESNVYAVVENSFVCPFKCRHSHLLCFYCGELFSEPDLLRAHTEEKHSPSRFRMTDYRNMVKIDVTRIDCRLCPAKIDSLDEFKKHITSVHKKTYYFQSQDHMLPFKLSKDNMKCALCDKSFPYFHALNKHMNEHFHNYVCETCGLGFLGFARFMMHQQRHEEGEFPCETCGKVFKAQFNRDLHIDRVHNKRGRVYCPKCDVKLMSYHSKLKHLIECHGEEPMKLKCEMCERVFESRRMLTLHKRKDHLKDYRYVCKVCGHAFFTRFSLLNHMPTHTGERNFKCKVCDKSYPRLKTLNDHVRIHTNDRRYRCEVCGQAFIQNCSLKGHMKSQHPEYG